VSTTRFAVVGDPIAPVKDHIAAVVRCDSLSGMRKHTAPRNSLRLVSETVRALTPGQLREVGGGGNIMSNAIPAPVPPPVAIP
jgi:hypothetical protein